VTAVGAFAHCRVHNTVAVWTVLGGRLSLFPCLRRLGLDRIDGTVARNVAREVQHQAVSLTRCETTTTAYDLYIQTCRFGRAQHGDQVYGWRIKTSGQHIGVGQALNTPSFKVLDESLALRLDPSEVMMCAAHNNDLLAAKNCGLKTAFWPRPTEYGPTQTDNLVATEAWDVVAKDIRDLATQMGV
jgi:hypothetical protein